MDLLRELEARCITGTLRFNAIEHDDAGEIELHGGDIAVEQAPIGGRDPVDVFLGAGALTYEIAPRLPVLPVSKGDEHHRRGSLRVHVPADLMQYCEHAGLTGILELVNGKRRVEATYEHGELIAIALDGKDDADLQQVFGWEEGEFRIEIDTEAPARLRRQAEAQAPSLDLGPARGEPLKPVKPREHTQKFLNIVEMALADVLDQSEKARDPTRTSPPLPAPPRGRPRKSEPPKKRRGDEATVQLIYLGGEGPKPKRDDSTRHVSGARAAEPALTPARRASDKGETMASSDENERDASSDEPSDEAPSEARAEPVASDTAEEPGPAAKEAEDKPAAPAKKAEEARPATATPAKPEAAKPEAAKPEVQHPAGVIAWVLVFFVLFAAIVFALAKLVPPQPMG